MQIIVVGGGVMGLSCVWRLAQAGASVTLLEARQCGEGATLAALGALWPPTPLASGPLQQLHRTSLGEFEAFTKTLSEQAALPIRFARHGRVELLESPHAVSRAREEVAASQALGTSLLLEFVEPAQVAAVQPGLRDATFGALLCRSTAQVVVADVVAALKEACRRAGVMIREGTRVTGFVGGEDAVSGVSVGEEGMSADRVLIASGAWTRLLPGMAHVPVRPVKGQGLALRMRREAMPATIVKAGTLYLVPWPEAEEVLVGSTTEPEAGFDEAPTPAGRAALLAGAASLMPSLRDAEVLRHWAGLRPQNSSKRHLPIMGPVPGKENLWLCTGHFKTGIGMAPLVSRIMAESIVVGRASDQLLPFSMMKSSMPS